MSRREKSHKIIVSVIESDVLMRQILSNMLRKEEGFQISGSTGFISVESHLSKLKTHRPDVILLGVDNIESEAMKLFYSVRKMYPDIFIIFLTVLSREGAAIALAGLKHGAIEYITKPDRRNGLMLADKHFQKRVLPVLKIIPRLNPLSLKSMKPGDLNHGNKADFVHERIRMSPADTDLIVIGSCLGGVRSLYKIISGLPGNLPVPVLIIQHMPKIYTEEFAEDLDKFTPLNVREAKNKSILVPGQVYVAPGGYHSVIKYEGNRNQIYLHKGPREHKCRPSIDVLLRSAVQCYGSRIISVFLSGGGSDGALGASMVMEHGGRVLLESKESSLLWGMAHRISNLQSGIKSYHADQLVSEMMRLMKSGIPHKNFPVIWESSSSNNSFTNLIGQ